MKTNNRLFEYLGHLYTKDGLEKKIQDVLHHYQWKTKWGKKTMDCYFFMKRNSITGETTVNYSAPMYIKKSKTL